MIFKIQQCSHAGFTNKEAVGKNQTPKQLLLKIVHLWKRCCFLRKTNELLKCLLPGFIE